MLNARSSSSDKGTQRHFIRADLAAIIPLSESSIAKHSSGDTSKRFAVAKYTPGCGLPYSSYSAEHITSKYLSKSNFSTTALICLIYEEEASANFTCLF